MLNVIIIHILSYGIVFIGAIVTRSGIEKEGLLIKAIGISLTMVGISVWCATAGRIVSCVAGYICEYICTKLG